MHTLLKYGKVQDNNNHWILTDTVRYIDQLTPHDRETLRQLYAAFQNIKGDDLIRRVYKNYPYYAINSTIAERLLSDADYTRVKENKPLHNSPMLCTIGYEGKSVEQYVNQLIQADIKVLCDVRKNPLSMKYGFSKNQLKAIVEGAGIEYKHFPQLGIASEKRQNLPTPESYRELFEDYRANTLPQQTHYTKLLYAELKKARRIALTCFEADVQCCHRHSLATELTTYFDEDFEVQHL